MAREQFEVEESPFRKVMRSTALVCMVGALGILGLHWSAAIGGTGDLVPVAIVLGVWANLLSLGLLFTRTRS